MAIFDKPFSFDEMLRRTIFKGRPNFFNSKDFNKELLIIHNFIEEFNKAFAVCSTVDFTIPSFSETFNSTTGIWNRVMNISWAKGQIMYQGVKYNIEAGGVSNYIQEYSDPNTSVSPKEVKPPSYIILTGELATITYADNPTLCGIQSDEVPSTVPTVDVEQWKNLQIKVIENPADFTGTGNETLICVLSTIHPRYKSNGSDNGYGFLYNTFKNADFNLGNGEGNEVSNIGGNQTMFEYILERVILKLSNVINEEQLSKRFNLSDLSDTAKARHNLGLSNLVNHRQLVQSENLRDLSDPILARYNLGLGSSAIKNVGYTENDVAPGNVLPVGFIGMWGGSPSSIPTGWVLCDGTNGTQDLRGKFIVGLDTSVEEFNVLGRTGGVKSVTLDNEMIPKHRFAFSGETTTDGEHTHGFEANGSYNDSGSGTAVSGDLHNQSLDKLNMTAEGDHKHTFSGFTEYFGGEASTGQTKSFSTLPPYFVLCYIVFKGASITPPTNPTNPAPLTYPNYSTPNSSTDDGYSDYEPNYIGGSNGITVGSGIILTNPE